MHPDIVLFYEEFRLGADELLQAPLITTRHLIISTSKIVELLRVAVGVFGMVRREQSDFKTKVLSNELRQVFAVIILYNKTLLYCIQGFEPCKPSGHKPAVSH